MPARPNRPGTNPPEDPAKRSETMRRVRSGDTTPELRVRALLTALGYRYRIRVKSLPGSPDVVFTARRKAVFVHGCFWHGHDCPRGARAPKANAAYWTAKIARNRARDAAAEAALTAQGWRCEIVWECALKDEAALAARLALLAERGSVHQA